MQKSGEIFSELIASDTPVSGTETTFEINFAVMKFRHTVKKDKIEKGKMNNEQITEED